MHFFIGSVLLSVGLVLLCIFKMVSAGAKSSPFECGFEPVCPLRSPFFIRFFLLAVLFLVFDLEISLLLPFLSESVVFSMLTFVGVCVVLLLGLFHEWGQGLLEW